MDTSANTQQTNTPQENFSRIDGIKVRLLTRINDIDSFLEYWTQNRKKVKKYNGSEIGNYMEKYSTYLSVLTDIITEGNLVELVEPAFGFEVFLFELDNLYNLGIAPLKVALDSLISSKGEVCKNIRTALKKLGSLIKISSFIEVSNNTARSITKECATGVSTNFPDSALNVLRDYLDVGRTLINDPIIKRLIKQIKGIHNSAVASNTIAMYSAIIGPSFMGKTQVAFTLACLINVIYVNVISACSEDSQKIYMLFKGIANLFVMVAQEDDAKLKAKRLDNSAEKIGNSNLSFRTLGLVYLIIRTRKVRESQSTSFSIYDWFVDLVRINSAIIPEMTIGQFREKTQDIDLSKLAVFIDELPKHNDDISSVVMFLRNLCRAARVPSFLSGTNSRVANLTGKPGSILGSRGEEDELKPWAIINVKSSKAFLQSFAKLVKIKENDKVVDCLTSFLTDLNAIKYEELFNTVRGPNADPAPVLFQSFVKLVDFLILQVGTSLPGIIALVFNCLLELLPKHSDPRELWNELSEKFTKSVSLRKKQLLEKNGLMATSHILTLPCAKHEIKKGDYSANLVENHLFYYGTRTDISFQLDLQFDQNADEYGSPTNFILVRDGLRYSDRCHFPELNEDFFTTFAALNMWNIGVIQKDAENLARWTMASLYESYLNMTCNYKVKVPKKVQNSFSFELLTYWSICHASHLNFNGQTDGVSFFWEFVKNLQKSFDSDGNVRTIKFSNSNRMNDNLEAILQKIKVPYMMRFPENPDLRNSLNNYIGDFIETGVCYFPPDKFGWDVAFDLRINGEGRTGLMECKYHDKAIGFAGFYSYYKKYCEELCSTYPIAFFICRKLGTQISAVDAEKKLLANLSNKAIKTEIVESAETNETVDEKAIDLGEPEEDEELYDPEEEKEKEKKNVPGTSSGGAKKRVIRDYPALLNELWLNPKNSADNSIDIYTVKYKEVEKKYKIWSESDNKETIIIDRQGTFTISALKTFPKPRGAFILVESNFTSPDVM